MHTGDVGSDDLAQESYKYSSSLCKSDAVIILFGVFNSSTALSEDSPELQPHMQKIFFLRYM